MVNIIRGIISLVIGIAFCVMQATGNYPGRGMNGYLLGVLLIAFGGYRLFRGVTQR